MIDWNKLHKELLEEVADQLKEWSISPETSGYQHEPMDNLSKKIFNHLRIAEDE